MSHAGRSIFWFSFWVLGSGLALLLFPRSMLALLAIDAPASPMAQVFGMVVLILGFYYLMAGRHGEMTPFYRWTTYTRSGAFLITLVLVAAGFAPPLLLAFVVVDLLGALWTWLALRQEA